MMPENEHVHILKAFFTIRPFFHRRGAKARRTVVSLLRDASGLRASAVKNIRS